MNKTVLVFLLASGLAGRAQPTNAPDARDFSSFKILVERNFFDPNRSPGSRGRADSPRAAKAEFFTLVGTLRYEKGTFAFFDGSSSEYRKVLKPSDAIAGYRIAQIAPDRVRLEADGRQIDLSVGTQMKKPDEGEWQLAGRAESSSQAEAVVDSGGKKADGSTGEETEVLKRLMQKREQELK